MRRVDIVIPCYNSMHTIRPVVEDIMHTMCVDYQTRVILVNDYSSDGVWQVIKDLHSEFPNIIGIDLSRNFGQQSARMAALKYVEGDYIIFMDDDGQHDPGYIPAMIDKIDEGFDIVYASFKKKEQTIWKTWGSNFRQLTATWLEEKPKGIHTSSFFATKRYVVDALKEYSSSTPVIFGYLMKITQNITSIQVPHRARIYGKTGYSFGKLVKLWLNAATSFSVVPLRLSSYLGFISSAVGIVTLIFIIIRKLINPQIAAGYTSTIALILLFSGIILVILGLIGEYIGKMFMSINRVPQYIVREVLDCQKTSQIELEDSKNV